MTWKQVFGGRLVDVISMKLVDEQPASAKKRSVMLISHLAPMGKWGMWKTVC